MQIYSPELVDLIGVAKEMRDRLAAIQPKNGPETVSAGEFRRWDLTIKHAEQLDKKLSDFSHS